MSGQVVSNINYNETGPVTPQTLPPEHQSITPGNTESDQQQPDCLTDFTQILTIIYWKVPHTPAALMTHFRAKHI